MLRMAALALGVVLIAVGLVGVGLYGYGVIDIVINKPGDRSWLFWGLPLGIGGAVSLITGIGLLFLWRYLRRVEE